MSNKQYPLNHLYDTTVSIVAVMLLSFSSLSLAQDDPAAIPVGPFDLVPTLELSVQKDDNIFSQSKGSETSSTLTIITPSLSAVADNGITALSINYALEDGSYSDTDNSDYTDQFLDLGLDWSLDVRHFLQFGIGYARAHDGRSEDRLTALTAADLDEYDDSNFSSRYIFGAPGARGRIELGYEYEKSSYNTNRATTADLDSEADTIDASLSLAIGAVTRLLFEVIEAETTFANNISRNRKDSSYLVGLGWEITDFTNGSAKIGRSESDLVNSADGTSGSTGEVAFEWSPYDYSVFTFSLGKEAQNTDNNVGSFIDQTQYQAAWFYDWSDELSMALSFAQQKDDYIGDNRNDDTQVIDVGFTYKARRWLNVGLNFSVENRGSNLTSAEYDRNIVELVLNTSL